MHHLSLRRRTLACWLALGAVQMLAAMPAPATGPSSLDAYLDTLERISPAARTGAEAYRQAIRRHCGHELTLPALRRAVAVGAGDPLLMALIRAAAEAAPERIAALQAQVRCAGTD